MEAPVNVNDPPDDGYDIVSPPPTPFIIFPVALDTTQSVIDILATTDMPEQELSTVMLMITRICSQRSLKQITR
jgi:hypothetical protein